MKSAEIRQAISSLHWERWLKRPINAFGFSLFKDSITRPVMRQAGIDAEYLASVFQDGVWYKSREVHKKFRAEIEKYLKHGGSIFKISQACAKLWRAKQKRILAMYSDPSSQLINNLAEFAEIINLNNAYVWLTYGFEEIYDARLKREVPKYIKNNVEEFILAVSVPSYKNSHALFEEKLAGTASLAKIRDEFGWIRSRDGFSRGFTLAELARMRKKIKQAKTVTTPPLPKIPQPLKKLISEVQELVYFRMLRGDARTNQYFLMRPLLRRLAKQYQIPFSQLRYYSVYDLIAGHPKPYPPEVTGILYRGEMLFVNAKVVHEEKIINQIIKGASGFKGVATGRAKIVTNLKALSKVKEGDVLVAASTFPAFISAMRRAVAFVTDEGGITCHAAVIAREMHKPCVVGTKIATRVLKDGDLVRVDAEHGLVEKIK